MKQVTTQKVKTIVRLTGLLVLLSASDYVMTKQMCVVEACGIRKAVKTLVENKEVGPVPVACVMGTET